MFSASYNLSNDCVTNNTKMFHCAAELNQQFGFQVVSYKFLAYFISGVLLSLRQVLVFHNNHIDWKTCSILGHYICLHCQRKSEPESSVLFLNSTRQEKHCELKAVFALQLNFVSQHMVLSCTLLNMSVNVPASVKISPEKVSVRVSSSVNGNLIYLLSFVVVVTVMGKCLLDLMTKCKQCSFMSVMKSI